MPGRSTSDASYQLIQDLYNARNRDEITVVAFLDLRKAFDTVNHMLLLHELAKIGCANSTLDWFKSYLTERSQTTTANGFTSSSRIIDCGVPQGSVLGPVLFVIYINNITNVIGNCRYMLYADDLVVYTSGKDVNIHKDLIQADLSAIDK